MSMKLNLKLLSTRFSQAKEQLYVPDDGVNPYLLEHILRPNLEGSFSAWGTSTLTLLKRTTCPRWRSITTGCIKRRRISPSSRRLWPGFRPPPRRRACFAEVPPWRI